MIRARSIYDSRVTHPEQLRADPAEQERRRAPLFSGLPVLVWVLCAAFVSSMLVWSVAKPIYGGMDERYHVGAGLYWEEFHEWPGFKDMPMMLSVMRSDELIGSGDHDAAAAVARQERPSFADLTSSNSVVSQKTMNQMSQHPPLYYAILGELHSLMPSGMASDLEVWIMRLLSAVLLAPLPLLAAALARRLGAGRPMIVVATAAIALLPGLAWLGGSVNNDNLLNAAAGWVFLGIGLVLTGDLRKRTALWIGLVLAVALLTKAFALPIAAGVVAAYLVEAIRSRRFRSGFAALAIAGVVAALGGWWWGLNLVRYGTFQPAGHGAKLDDPLGVAAAFPIYADKFLDVFSSRFWIGLDATSLADPLVWIALTATVLVLGVIVVAIIAGLRSTGRQAALNTLVLLAPMVLAFLILMYSTYRITMNTGYAAGLQGRYLYCAIIGVAAAFAVSAGFILPRRTHRFVMLATVLVGIAVCVWRVCRAIVNEWAPSGSLGDHLHALFAWSPLPYGVSVAILVAFCVSILAAAAMLTREFGIQRPAGTPHEAGGRDDDSIPTRGRVGSSA